MNPHDLAPPSAVGQRVRARAYGGPVKQYMVSITGTVIRFTPKGAPVVRMDGPPPNASGMTIINGNYHNGIVRDTYGCFMRLTADGMWLRQQDLAEEPFTGDPWADFPTISAKGGQPLVIQDVDGNTFVVCAIVDTDGRYVVTVDKP
jgi:hypothetical protein